MRVLRCTPSDTLTVVVRDCDVIDSLEGTLHFAARGAGYTADEVDWEIFDVPEGTSIETATAIALERMRNEQERKRGA